MKIYPPGSTIAGRYEVVSKPMVGGMGVVYFCLDHGNDGRPIALKTFRPELLPDRAARDRFLREGTAWVDLGSHPHIVRCYAVEYIDPTAFLSLELIAKEQGMKDASLRAWIGTPMPVEQALLFALQIARGLQYASEKIPGFVHRDLKPENVLVGADKLSNSNVNRLRVTDFGLAAILKDESEGTKKKGGTKDAGRTQLTHGIVGTPFYMAPEQWTGETVGVYTDVYALGCILHEMLSGQFAVKGTTYGQLQEAHCSGRLQPRPKSLPEDVDVLLTKCLATDPGLRYGNWGELVMIIERSYAKQTGVSAPSLAGSSELSREEHRQVGWSYNEMGVAYLDMGKADVAARYFEKALTVAQQAANRRGEGVALGNLGLAHVDLGNVQRAIGYHEQNLAIAREVGDRSGEGAALGNLGIAHTLLGDAWLAIEHYERQIAITREIRDRRREGGALGNLGNAYAALGDARRALGYYEQALTIHREIRNRRGEGDALGNLGIVYDQLGDTQRAIGYFEKHSIIAREIGDRAGEGASLGNLGNAYLNLGDARSAIGYFEQYLAIAREIGDRRAEGTTLGNLGNAYLNLGDPRRAIEYYEQHLAIAREIGDRRGEAEALGNTGAAYAQMGDAQRAIGYHKQYLAITREIGDRRGEGKALGNLGNAYLNLGDSQQAIEYTQNALRISQETGDIVTAGMFRVNLGLSLAQAGRVKDAIPLIEKAIEDFYQAGYPHHAQNAEGMLAQVRDRSMMPAHLLDAAFDALQHTGSLQEVRSVVEHYPFMTDDRFIHMVEQVAKEQVPANLKPAWEHRVVWLQQIAGKQEPSVLSRLFGKKK